jgi:hypothetical protein
MHLYGRGPLGSHLQKPMGTHSAYRFLVKTRALRVDGNAGRRLWGHRGALASVAPAGAPTYLHRGALSTMTAETITDLAVLFGHVTAALKPSTRSSATTTTSLRPEVLRPDRLFCSIPAEPDPARRQDHQAQMADALRRSPLSIRRPYHHELGHRVERD